jgi:hypothetical protein
MTSFLCSTEELKLDGVFSHLFYFMKSLKVPSYRFFIGVSTVSDRYPLPVRHFDSNSQSAVSCSPFDVAFLAAKFDRKDCCRTEVEGGGGRGGG